MLEPGPYALAWVCMLQLYKQESGPLAEAWGQVGSQVLVSRPGTGGSSRRLGSTESTVGGSGFETSLEGLRPGATPFLAPQDRGLGLAEGSPVLSYDPDRSLG
jgi:hypothetical protein